MNLKEQQYVCTLARCQTISKAAEELYISPSALSVYISNLEKYLGISLFLQTGRSFVLTPIGEEYRKRFLLFQTDSCLSEGTCLNGM